MRGFLPSTRNTSVLLPDNHPPRDLVAVRTTSCIVLRYPPLGRGLRGAADPCSVPLAGLAGLGAPGRLARGAGTLALGVQPGPRLRASVPPHVGLSSSQTALAFRWHGGWLPRTSVPGDRKWQLPVSEDLDPDMGTAPCLLYSFAK